MQEIIQTILSYGPVAIWVIVLVVTLILEGLTAGLVSLWFSGAALVCIVLALLNVPVWIQIVAFLAISLLLLLSLRPLMSKWLDKNKSATNIDSVIGAEAKVVETINNIEQTGAVKLQGKTWTARNVNDTNDEILEGTIVRVVSIQGVKLLVEYKKDTED